MPVASKGGVPVCPRSSGEVIHATEDCTDSKRRSGVVDDAVRTRFSSVLHARHCAHQRADVQAKPSSPTHTEEQFRFPLMKVPPQTSSFSSSAAAGFDDHGYYPRTRTPAPDEAAAQTLRLPGLFLASHPRPLPVCSAPPPKC